MVHARVVWAALLACTFVMVLVGLKYLDAAERLHSTEQQLQACRTRSEQVERSLAAYRSECSKAAAMAESMLAEAIESRDRVRAGSATAASELSSAQERLAKLTKLCDATQVALGDEQQRSRELELQLGAAQAQLTRLQRESAASDELQAQLSLLREQLQAAQQPQPQQPPPPPQQQATEEPSDGSALVARSSLDLCREVAHPAAQLRRVDVSGDRYEIESGITKVQQQYLHQRLFAPRLPAVVPSNLHANNASHLWAWQQAELRALDQRFPRLFAVLRLRDFCIAGRGGITAVAWDRERVLSGQLFEPMPPMSHGECVPLKRAIYAEFPWSNSFQHFVVDELPRLAPILWMMRDDPELKLIVQSSTIAADILSAFGVDMRDRLVPYRLSSVFCAHELLYPHGWPGGYTMEGRAAELVYLAHRQLFPVDLAPEQRTYIIYTSRPGTRARGATNQDDVIAEVQQWIKRHKRREQLKIWSDGTHSVEEAIEWWKQARVVVGTHGGALANLVWLPADDQTAVVEICPTGKPSVSWWSLAAGMRVHYWQILVSNTTHETPLEVPLGALRETLEAVQEHLSS